MGGLRYVLQAELWQPLAVLLRATAMMPLLYRRVDKVASCQLQQGLVIDGGLQLRDAGLMSPALCHKPNCIRLCQDRIRSPFARSEPNKPSSSFDLSFDNKDSDYGSQGRGYAGYQALDRYHCC